GRRFDRQRPFSAGKEARSHAKWVLSLLPGMDVRHGGHLPQPRLLKSGTDDEWVAVAKEKQPGQPFASVEIDAGEVAQIRRRGRIQPVRPERGKVSPHAIHTTPVNRLFKRHIVILAEGLATLDVVPISS